VRRRHRVPVISRAIRRAMPTRPIPTRQSRLHQRRLSAGLRHRRSRWCYRSRHNPPRCCARHMRARRIRRRRRWRIRLLRMMTATGCKQRNKQTKSHSRHSSCASLRASSRSAFAYSLPSFACHLLHRALSMDIQSPSLWPAGAESTLQGAGVPFWLHLFLRIKAASGSKFSTSASTEQPYGTGARPYKGALQQLDCRFAPKRQSSARK
jgi:hypothetical protein